jgi:hypothetical protein
MTWGELIFKDHRGLRTEQAQEWTQEGKKGQNSRQVMKDVIPSRARVANSVGLKVFCHAMITVMLGYQLGQFTKAPIY